MVGGGSALSTTSPSLYSCVEMVENGKEMLPLPKDKMKNPRTGHSICTLSDKILLATGSRHKEASGTCEVYDID